MTNAVHNVSSSSSSLKRIKTHASGNRSISPPPRSRIRKRNVAFDDITTSADAKDDTPAFDPNCLHHDLLCIVKCNACDFQIEVSLPRGHSEEFDVNDTICPMCNQKLREDAIKTAENSSFAFMHSLDWTAVNLGNEPALGGNKHARMSGSYLSPSQDNLDGQSFNDFNSEEDDTTDASDDTAAKGVSIAKSLGGADAPNTGGNEQDIEERSERAAFAQKMFLSALFSE